MTDDIEDPNLEPTLWDHAIDAVKYTCGSVGLIAFVIVLTTGIADIFNNSSTSSVHALSPGFWLMLCLLSFLIYAMMLELEGQKYGEVNQLDIPQPREEYQRAEVRVY